MSRILRQPAGPDSTQRVQLDGREFVLRWRWLQRAARWALDVSDAEGVLLAGGLRVIPNVPLLRYVRGARPEMPPGELVILDGRSPTPALTLDSLGGDRARIVYVTEAELAEAAA